MADERVACSRKSATRIRQRVASYHTTEVIAHWKPKSGCPSPLSKADRSDTSSLETSLIRPDPTKPDQNCWTGNPWFGDPVPTLTRFSRISDLLSINLRTKCPMPCWPKSTKRQLAKRKRLKCGKTVIRSFSPFATIRLRNENLESSK